MMNHTYQSIFYTYGKNKKVNMQYKYNKYYSHGAPKIVRDFTTHSYTPLTHTTSFHISIQYNHNITAQTTNNTHKAVNQATKPMGSRPVAYSGQ